MIIALIIHDVLHNHVMMKVIVTTIITIIVVIITLIIIWSNTALPVHNMMVSLARRCHGRLRDGEASFFGRRRYQRTKSHSSANNIHWTCPNRGAVCVVNATSDP